jgi:ATP-dependent DNA helicase RecG
MVDACKAQGVPEPEYEVNGGFVSIVFRRATGKVDEGVNGYVNGYVNGGVNSLTPSQKNVYDIVCDNPGINTKRIADILKKSPRTIEKHIALLAKTGLIEHRDSDKTGGYYPVEK